MSGSVQIWVMGVSLYQCKFRIRGNYILIKSKKKSSRQKLTDNNINFLFFKKFVEMVYFRQHITDISVSGVFGYQNNAFTTAMMCSTFDIIVTNLMCRLKNNKQSANINVNAEPKYDRDVFSMEMLSKFNMSLFDIAYAFVMTKFRLMGGRYERKRTANIQKNRVTN